MREILYNSIGTGYNTTRRADAHIAERIYDHLAPEKKGLYLDIGCGTGNYTIALSEMGLNMFGVDPSEKMLQEATSRSNNISWLVGMAESLPLPHSMFDGIAGMLTIHHWTDLDTAFKELDRVLKRNGRIVFFTATPEQMTGYWLRHYFPKMMEKSGVQMPPLEKIAAAAAKAGLETAGTEKYFVSDDLQDSFLYIGKNNPELYFDEVVRNGISSFAALSNKDEVQAGLTQLRTDIDNGAFPAIKEQYENELGDYLFVTLQKKT